MKKLFTLSLALSAMLSASADWNGPEENNLLLPEGTSVYNNEFVTGEDGTTYFMCYRPNLQEAKDEYDIDNVVYEYRLQAIDKDGNKKFGELGMLVSDYANLSWCMVNNYLYVDKDGNVIFTLTDCRNSEYSGMLSIYAYKISPEGEMLWGEEGVALGNGAAYEVLCAMKTTQLDDGSYVFAWMRSNGDLLGVEMQRLSADGEPLWDMEEVSLVDDTISYSYPYLVNAGMNQVIVVFAKGGGQDIYARKLDFDGTPVWAEDARIYRGGWGSIPIWTLLDVKPSGDGGVIVGWNDDRDYTNVESAYISYVTPDGKLGFANASDEGDVKLSYGGWKMFNCKVIADPNSDSFLAMSREVGSTGQSYQRLMLQRISKEGELLYGDEGKLIMDYELASYGYMSLQLGNEGEAAAFYMDYNEYDDVNGYVLLFDIETGDFEEPILISTPKCGRSNLKSQVCPNEKFWIVGWEETYMTAEGTSDERHKIQRIDFDGTITSGIESVTVADNQGFSYADGKFIVDMTADGNAKIEIFDIAGKKVAEICNGVLSQGVNSFSWVDAQSGIYVARLSADNKIATKKVLIK